ncbi:UNVERIFIED_CONTAM: hypothetical protein Scaly_0076900 [Sesamum calycinum]|uniref:DUF659 domain-containing protein n=1 Tax=Sesamum calycinum TaxID=2727403 RepID=A0AAW2SVY3_9LAMI
MYYETEQEQQILRVVNAIFLVLVKAHLLHQLCNSKSKHKLVQSTCTLEKNLMRWIYDAGLPFNVVHCESLGPTIEAIGQYGPGMKPPSYYEVRVKYLKKEMEHTNNILKAWEEDQAKYGCSLMADGWTDRKHLSLINFLVNSPKGIKFIGSVDASSSSHTGEKLFELLDKFVQQIGEKNVIQVITDASANVLAGFLLEAKYPHLYWTPCGAHCIDLMFENFFKIQNLKKTYEQAVMINGYIYNSSPLLDTLWDFIAKRYMVRLNLSDEDDDEENARVYEDDDLTWSDVARAFGVDEYAYAFCPCHSKELKNTTSKASSSKDDQEGGR